MAQVYNPETGEWEEKPDEGTNAFSTGGTTATGPGLSSLYNPQQSTVDTTSTGTGAKIYENTPAINGGDSFGSLGTNWIERDGFRADSGTGELFRNENGNWNPVTTANSFYDPNGPGTNERLQMIYGMTNAPASVPLNNIREWSTQNGWREPNRSSGMTLGEALLKMGAMAVGAGALDGFGSGNDISSLMDMNTGAAGGFTDPIGTGIGAGGDISSLLGDTSYWDMAGNGLSGFESSLPSGITEVPSSLTNMEQGFRELSQLNNPSGWNTSPLNPEVTALENTGSTSLSDIIEPKQFIDDAGVGTNAAGDMVNAKGQRAWQDVMSEKLRPTLGIDGAGSTVNGLSNAWTKLTTPIGGNKMSDGGILSKLFKAPTPLELGVRGLGSLDSWIQGKKAQDVMEEQMNRMRGAEDSNAARGSAANDMWLRTQQDPMYGYDSFMQGAGRDFTNNARAAAAKSGSRGSYLNSGRMNSDLASLWQKNQTQRAASIAGGFSNSPYSSSSSLTPGYANLIKNQNAPLFQGLSGAMQGFKLADLFGGD